MVGSQVREQLVSSRRVPAAKSSTVMNGIPVHRFERSSDTRAQVRDELGIAQDALVVGTVGRLVELKNQRLLLEAAALLRPSWPGLVVVLAGDGPLRDDLVSLARQLGMQDSVVFTGPRQDVPRLLNAFDVFALPSRTEGLSIALLEACAAGLPLVATRVGGNDEIVQEHQTGLLIPSDDVSALRAALSQLLEDPAQRLRMGENARRWVVEHGSIEVMRENYAALYTSASGRR